MRFSCIAVRAQSAPGETRHSVGCKPNEIGGRKPNEMGGRKPNEMG